MMHVPSWHVREVIRLREMICAPSISRAGHFEDARGPRSNQLLRARAGSNARLNLRRAHRTSGRFLRLGFRKKWLGSSEGQDVEL